MKIINLLLLTCIYFVLIASSCRKEKTCVREYKPEFPIHIFPQQDTFAVGDTIWVDLTYASDSLIDMNNQIIVAPDSFDFSLLAILGKYDSLSLEDGLDYFSFGAKTGEINRIDLVTISNLVFTFEVINNTHKVNFFITPEQSGYFQIGFNSNYSPKHEVDFIDSNCEEFLNIVFKTNDGLDNNFDHYKNNSPDETVSLEGYNRIGLYSFVVIE